MTGALLIRPFERTDLDAVVALWHDCDLVRPWNDPVRDIERKLLVQPQLFLVAEKDAAVVGSVMAGYDGHRGWVNYLAVSPTHQHRGIARQLISRVEDELLAIGCPKINLQVRDGNDEAIGFYAALGYAVDPVVSLGKRLVPDAPRVDECTAGTRVEPGRCGFTPTDASPAVRPRDGRTSR
jgi:ribosomal protein S18 acetylase RimI-like enzyme